MKYNINRILSILALIVFITTHSSASNTIVTSGADSGPGTLREALIDSTTADTVFFDPSVTTFNITSEQILILRDVTIIGNGQNQTILKGAGNNGTDRLLSSNFDINIQSLTLRDGFNDGGEGGAIFCGGTWVLEDVLIANNKATSNGGAILLHGDMTLINVTLDNNRTTSTTSGRGGAISIRSGTLTMDSCRVTNNRSEFSAGAISSLNQTSKLFVNHSIFQGNSTPNSGGNIVMFGDTVSIANSLITGNKSNTGGGLYLVDVNVGIFNSTIAANRCELENSSLGRGAGIYIERNTNIYMANTIVGNNTLDNTVNGPDIFFASNGEFIDLGGNLISDNTDINNTAGYISLLIGTSAQPINPAFVQDVDSDVVPTTSGDFRLRCSSPAIDMGKDTLGLTMGVDIAGSSRLVNGVIDIGAHERQLQTSYLVTNTANDGIGSLRNAVNLSCPGDTVLFDQMIDGEQIKLTTGQIDINNNIEIFGNGQGNTIIDGNGMSRIFYIHEGVSTTISNMAIQNGSSTEPNHQVGGGIRNYKGNLKLYDVHITNCTADGGGGLQTQFEGITEIQRCRFSGNSASGVGGGLISEGVTTILNSVISGNSAGDGGGGIYVSNTASLTNVTISGNRELSASGGGILHDGILLTMINTIIAKNESSSAETDIHKRGNVAVVTDDGYNLLGDTTGIGQPLAATTIFGTSTTPLDPTFFKDADFSESEYGDMRLRCTSPAINMGTPDTSGLSIGSKDLSGLLRIVNNIIDIGAHERPAETAIREVVNNNDSGPGSLRDAVVTACTGDVVEIDEGVNGQTINIIDELVIDTDIAIIGNGIEQTIIDGGSSNRIFHIKPGVTSNISSMKIRKGRADSPMNGGGIKNEGDVTIDQMIIENCLAFSNGGGIYNSPTGVLTIDQMLIDECGANGNGGGIYNSPAGILTFNNSTIYKSFGGDKGGGIFNAGQASFDRSAISANFTLTNDGGGVYNLGIIDLTNSTISANEGGDGFQVNGGGIYNDGIFTITNSTVAGNKADHGGGIFNDSTFTMTNTIIAKNISGMGPDIRSDTALITDLGYNLIGDTTSLNQPLHLHTLTGNEDIPLDPLFLRNPAIFFDIDQGDVKDPGNLRLACSSPAIDMGTPNTSGLGIGSTDILGLSRIANGRVDIGAHERISASINHMVTNSNDSGLGSLRDEILSVCPTDTLFFDPVTNDETIQLTSTELVIDRDVTIIGNGTRLTVIDGMDNKRILFIDNGISASISSLIIRNGRAINEVQDLMDGGCIYVNDGSLNLDNVNFHNCHADNGGAIYALDTITLSDCFISGCDADGQGGGIFNSSYASLVNSLIFQNHADLGGGIYNESGAMSFVDTELSYNTADQSGGGILNTRSFDGSPGVITFKNSIISNNSIPGPNQTNNALLGGGVLTAGGESTFINTVIMGNTSEKGGGVFNGFESTATFINSTMSLNIANVGPVGHGGAGLYNDGSANFTNTIVAKNFSTVKRDIFNGFNGSLTDNGNNLIGDSTGVGTDFNMSILLGTEASQLDPNFVSTNSRDLRLWCTSPAVDAGTTDTTGLQVGLVDLQGSARIVGDAIDIGAYEYFRGHVGDLVLSNSIRSIERATNITALTGVNALSTLFQVEETVILEDVFDVDVGKTFEVQVEECPE